MGKNANVTGINPVEYPDQYFLDLPKVDLHRHLEGSLRLSTLVEIARLNGLAVPTSTAPLRPLVQVQQDEPATHQNFLAKFNVLRNFYRSPEVIQRVTREAVQDAAADNVRCLELRFTPVALSNAGNFPLDEVMDWVCTSARDAARESGMKMSMIASINRHESLELAGQVARLAADRINQGLTGLDLAGNEADFPAAPFAGIFQEARQAGLKLTIHAGEWGSAENVREAIELFHADRIGHGIKVLQDPRTVDMARECSLPFEVCITSNIQSGAAPSLEGHPVIEMLKQGLNVTLGTDDPSISNITLSGEYRTAVDQVGITVNVLHERILAAAHASFLPDADRESLLADLKFVLK